jgi:hippurate hydrolase
VHPSVVTVGRVVAGTAANVIAEEAVLEGTIRTTLPEVRDHIHRGLHRIGKAIAELHNAKIDVHVSDGYPPVVNSIRETGFARHAVVNTVGEAGVAAMDYPSMGSEDFSYYLQQLPGCYVRFGARRREDEYIPLHSPAFDIDEQVLKIGAAFFDQVAREALHGYRG